MSVVIADNNVEPRSIEVMGERRLVGWLVLVLALALASWAQHRDVVTTQGTARGYLAPRPPHYAYLGLPFARAPATHHRFKAPAPPSRWDGVFEATYRVRCAQPHRRATHACLALNVFAPEHARALPVVTHVHGGHFARGWGSHEPPSRLLSQGFVVVTLNYRLGADGFLCLGTEEVPGNAGLKDQVAALYWVHRNIDKFGGDPHQVTLYGTGAGAACAEFLLLSGAIQELVQRVILESGTALSPTSLSYNPIAAAREVAISLGYQNDETQTMDDLSVFFEESSRESLVNYSNTFMPCVENSSNSVSSLFTEDPKEILEKGSFGHMPLLIVYSKEVYDSTLDESTAQVLNTMPDDFEELLPNNLEFTSDIVKSRIAEQIKDLYFGDNILGGDVAKSYENYMNDVFAVYPAVKSASLHARSDLPVYLLEFNPQIGNKTVFDYIFSGDDFSYEDELVAEKFVSLWSNFMKYSDPTPLATTLVPVVWQPVTFVLRSERVDISIVTCLIFDLNNGVVMDQPSSGHTLVIWDHLYDNFYKFHAPELD